MSNWKPEQREQWIKMMEKTKEVLKEIQIGQDDNVIQIDFRQRAWVKPRNISEQKKKKSKN
jgi:hypothetical protein